MGVVIRRVLALLGLTLFVTFTAAPTAARADDEPAAADEAQIEAARQRFEEGKRLYNSGDYRGAVREFRAAQEIKPSPILDYNIALSYEKLGRLRLAVRYYRGYLEGSPDADNRVETEQKIRNLEERLARNGDAPDEGEGDAPPPVAPIDPGGPPPSPPQEPPGGAGGEPPPAPPLRRLAVSLSLGPAINSNLGDFEGDADALSGTGFGLGVYLAYLLLPESRIGLRAFVSTAAFTYQGNQVDGGALRTTAVGGGGFVELQPNPRVPFFITPMVGAMLNVISGEGALGEAMADACETSSFTSGGFRVEVAGKYLLAERHGLYLTPVGVNLLLPAADDGSECGGVVPAVEAFDLDRGHFTLDVHGGYELRF